MNIDDKRYDRLIEMADKAGQWLSITTSVMMWLIATPYLIWGLATADPFKAIASAAFMLLGFALIRGIRASEEDDRRYDEWRKSHPVEEAEEYEY